MIRSRKRKDKKKLTNAELWKKELERIEREMRIMSELGVRAQMLEMRNKNNDKCDMRGTIDG